MGYKSFIVSKGLIVSKGIIGLLLLEASHVTTQLEYMTIFKRNQAHFNETKRTLMNLFKKVGKFKFTSVDMQCKRVMLTLVCYHCCFYGPCL